MRTIMLGTPVDVAEAVPVLLRFRPEDSVVMLTLEGARPFHARVDLPRAGGEEMMLEALCMPAVSNGVRRVLFVLYSDDMEPLRTLLVDRFTDRGVDVVDVLRVKDGLVFHGDLPGQPFKDESLVALEAAAEDGQVVEATRQGLHDRVAYHPGAVSPVDVAGLDVNEARVACGLVRHPDCAATWQQALATVADGDDLLPYVAAVAALAAWLNGDGAMAWCCLDRAPRQTALAGLVTMVLEQAVSPDMWDELRTFTPTFNPTGRLD